MPKLSSEYGSLPRVCERCGAPAQPVNDQSLAVAGTVMMCCARNHGWFVPVENPPPILKRKADRRRDARVN